MKWLDGVSLPDFELIKNLEKYKIHELDLKACLKGNQRARVDKYDNYSFIVFHAPKYNKTTKMYELNEFDIFLSKKFIITFREYSFSKIDKIFDYFTQGSVDAQ